MTAVVDAWESPPTVAGRGARFRTAAAAVSVWIAAGWGLAAMARGHQIVTVGDGAMIELYTIHATRLGQLLGPYSQYGWHHPGPMMFYAFVPFYLLSGHSTFGLNAAALALNLAALAGVLRLGGGRGRSSTAFALSLFAALLLYVARVPALLVSVWNPHLPILPFAAAILAAASAVAGAAGCLPVVAVAASFAAQSHVAFAPAAGVLIAVAFLAQACRALAAPPFRRTFLWWTLVSVFGLDLAWMFPLAEQIASPGAGNMTQIWRFFLQSDSVQPLATAWRAWAGALSAAFRPGFVLAGGAGYVDSASGAALVAASACVLALVPASIMNWRRRQRFEAALSAICFAIAFVAFWSVRHVQNTIGDYQVFWLSILGVLIAACVAAAVLDAVAGDMRAFLPRRAPLALAGVVLAAAAAIGTAELRHQIATWRPGGFETTAQSLSDQALAALPSLGGHRPLVRLDASAGPSSIGVLLQFAKASIPFAVDADWAPLFGARLAATGREDILVTVSGRDVHRKMLERPHNAVLASADRGSVFVDAVSLVDEPQFRPE